MKDEYEQVNGLWLPKYVQRNGVWMKRTEAERQDCVNADLSRAFAPAETGVYYFVSHPATVWNVDLDGRPAKSYRKRMTGDAEKRGAVDEAERILRGD